MEHGSVLQRHQDCFICTSYTNLTCGWFTRWIRLNSSIRMERHGVRARQAEGQLDAAETKAGRSPPPRDAFLFDLICKGLGRRVKPLPAFGIGHTSCDGTGCDSCPAHRTQRRAEGVIFLRETRSERPINATRHQQKSAKINTPPSSNLRGIGSLIGLSKFRPFFLSLRAFSSVPGGY